MSRSLSSSTPRYEKVRKVRFFLSSAATLASVISAYNNKLDSNKIKDEVYTMIVVGE